MKWEELSMSDRSNLMKTYLQNGVIRLSDMRDHYNKFVSGGPLRDEYDNPDQYYDYRTAEEVGDMYDPKSKHWASRDPRTGMILKNPKHPTFGMAIREDKADGYSLYIDSSTGRYYTLRPGEYATSPYKPTLRRINNFDGGGYTDLPVRDSTQPILRPILAGNFQDIEEESAPERPKKVITLDNLHELATDNPTMYKEYMQRLPKEYQAKVIENASRNRYGYEGLNKAMFAASSLPLATYAGAAYSSIPKSVKTFVDIIGSVDGLRNMVSHNGISKTVRKAKEGDVVGTLLSGAGDALDFLGGASYLSTLRNNFLNRNIIAYNNISPAAYTGHGKEMAGALYDFFFTKADKLAPKYNLYKSSKTSQLKLFPQISNASDRSKQFIAAIGRDEAYRKYLGLPSKRPVFVQGSKGNVEYNLDYLLSLAQKANPDGPPIAYNINPFLDVSDKKLDFVTGAFGGLDQKLGSITMGPRGIEPTAYTTFRYLPQEEISEYRKAQQRKYSKYTYHVEDGYERIGNYHFRNTWDINPIQDSHRNMLGRFGELLPKSIRSMEIGPILKGTPFTIDQFIPYTQKSYKTGLNGVPLRWRTNKELQYISTHK